MCRESKSNTRESDMNRDRIEGNWKQFRGKVRQQWGKVTFDRLAVAVGKNIFLSGQIQESRGIYMEEVRKQRVIRGRNAELLGDMPSTPDIEIYNSPNLELYTGSISTILSNLRNGENP
jgi:uncharacterized protein YjbJ (UPF0337 family)